MPTAIAYVRVSTESQVTEGVSLEAQQAKIAAWCAVNDFELVESFEDAGISGTTMGKRPGLQAAIEAACERKAALVVYSLSRLARSVKDTISISEQLNAAGADLVSLSEKLDTTSAAGKMIFRMMAVMAEFERDQISERTTAALQFKKRRGERIGNLPFGYQIAEDGKTLVENPQEQETIALARSLRSQGMKFREIAAYLEVAGHVTRGGKPFDVPALTRMMERKAVA